MQQYTPHDIADRDDAQIAKYAQSAPRAFARLLTELNAMERAIMRLRVENGLRWIGQNQEKEHTRGGVTPSPSDYCNSR